MVVPLFRPLIEKIYAIYAPLNKIPIIYKTKVKNKYIDRLISAKKKK